MDTLKCDFEEKKNEEQKNICSVAFFVLLLHKKISSKMSEILL